MPIPNPLSPITLAALAAIIILASIADYAFNTAFSGFIFYGAFAFLPVCIAAKIVLQRNSIRRAAICDAHRRAIAEAQAQLREASDREARSNNPYARERASHRDNPRRPNDGNRSYSGNSSQQQKKGARTQETSDPVKARLASLMAKQSSCLIAQARLVFEDGVPPANLKLYLHASGGRGDRGAWTHKFTAVNSKFKVIWSSSVTIGANGLGIFEIEINGKLYSFPFNIFAPVQTVNINIAAPASSNSQDHQKSTGRNPFMEKAERFMQEEISTLEQVVALRRKIAKAIHPDLGPAEESLNRNEALAWANAKLDEVSKKLARGY